MGMTIAVKFCGLAAALLAGTSSTSTVFAATATSPTAAQGVTVQETSHGGDHGHGGDHDRGGDRDWDHDRGGDHGRDRCYYNYYGDYYC